MMENDHVLKQAKKYFLKDRYSLAFNVLGLIFIVFSLLRIDFIASHFNTFRTAIPHIAYYLPIGLIFIISLLYYLKEDKRLAVKLFVLGSAILVFFVFFISDVMFSNISRFISVFSFVLLFSLGLLFLISGALAFFDMKRLMFIPIIIWLLITTAVFRTSNMPILKNAATGDWELGPDLDPYLFLRNAQEIVDRRNMGELDQMRYAPLGASNDYIHKHFMPWSIVAVYRLINYFGDYSVTYAGIIAPVIFFIISLVGFFLFMYVIFSFKFSKENALAGATIASFIYAFVPAMVHRTTAGIPELESLGMVWFWLAFLFFALAWKSDNKKKMIIFGALAGIFTGAMGWTWGGYKYIYMIVGLAVFLAFLVGIEKKKNFIVLGSFLAMGLLVEYIRVRSLQPMLMSFTDIGFAVGVLVLMIFDFVLFKTKAAEKLKLKRINLPGSIITILFTFVVLFIFLLVFNPGFITAIFNRVIGGLLTPFGTGRIALTVAENKAPYFADVFGNFGYLFWLFLFGVILLFYESVKHFNLREKIILNSFFILFLLTFIFSRISPQHILNGDNFISKALYLGGLAIFGIVFVGIFIKSYIKGNHKTFEDFRKIDFFYILLISFSFWAVVSMRGAVRLFFIIAPMLAIIASFFLIRLFTSPLKRNDTLKPALICLIVVVIFVFGHLIMNFSFVTAVSVMQTGHSEYNKQWQMAMHWASENTPEGSIFVHWWDYGYWVQTLGKRPTVTDGGHFIDWWDHTTGRYLLTTPRPETALSLMKTHNVSYLLIDSSDVGKYTAFSSIGSDASGRDRIGWIPTFIQDPKQTQETANGVRMVYPAGVYVDKDIHYNLNGTSVFLPEGKAALVGIIIETSNVSMMQPEAVFINANRQQQRLPVRYVYFEDRIIDFGSGINVTLRIVPSIIQSGGNIGIDAFGSIVYLSEKTMNSLFAELYLMNDPHNNYETIKLAHVEYDYIVTQLRQNGFSGEFVYFQGLRGPIKIWDTREIPEDIIVREEFLYPPAGWSQLTGPWGYLDDMEFRR
jgi:asparagine N-glycosylation enzyme membrane subunit Stt3